MVGNGGIHRHKMEDTREVFSFTTGLWLPRLLSAVTGMCAPCWMVDAGTGVTETLNLMALFMNKLMSY